MANSRARGMWPHSRDGTMKSQKKPKQKPRAHHHRGRHTRQQDNAGGQKTLKALKKPSLGTWEDDLHYFSTQKQKKSNDVGIRFQYLLLKNSQWCHTMLLSIRPTKQKAFLPFIQWKHNSSVYQSERNVSFHNSTSLSKVTGRNHQRPG
jgi:hypothetical protein